VARLWPTRPAFVLLVGTCAAGDSVFAEVSIPPSGRDLRTPRAAIDASRRSGVPGADCQRSSWRLAGRFWPVAVQLRIAAKGAASRPPFVKVVRSRTWQAKHESSPRSHCNAFCRLGCANSNAFRPLKADEGSALSRLQQDARDQPAMDGARALSRRLADHQPCGLCLDRALFDLVTGTQRPGTPLSRRCLRGQHLRGFFS
jgi:hypothetical protein